jgi:hypothetical protein
MTDPRFDDWLEALQRRHLADLEFSQVTRAVRALSARYVERRTRLAERGGLDTAGKRAAYAVYYSPLHFLIVRSVVESLPASLPSGSTLADLGCGGGAAGAAWGSFLGADVIGVDTHPWAVAEAPHAYRAFGLKFDMRRAHVVHTPIARKAKGIVLGWVVNELDAEARDALLGRLLEAAGRGVATLILEPIATRLVPWWPDWVEAFKRIGGRADEWRFPVTLPDWLARLDRAAGMRHDELTARSIYIAPRTLTGLRTNELQSSSKDSHEEHEAHEAESTE